MADAIEDTSQILVGGGTWRNLEELGGTERNREELGGTHLVSPLVEDTSKSVKTVSFI